MEGPAQWRGERILGPVGIQFFVFPGPPNGWFLRIDGEPIVKMDVFCEVLRNCPIYLREDPMRSSSNIVRRINTVDTGVATGCT